MVDVEEGWDDDEGGGYIEVRVARSQLVRPGSFHTGQDRWAYKWDKR